MSQFELPDPPNDGITAVKFAPNSSNRLLVSSWDSNVYFYDTTPDEAKLLQKFESRAAVLDVTFGRNDNEAFAGGLDWDVRRIDLESGEQTVISEHNAPVNCVAYSSETNILVSASFDSTLHIHIIEGAKATSVSTIQLPHKAYSISLSPSKLVVAMANRAVYIYDIKTLKDATYRSQTPQSTINVEPWQQRESSMKFQIRAVACMPNDSGYASSSIEGRIAVEWFDPSDESQKRKYAFKCHRSIVENENTDYVYPVHALAFHPVFGTFASGGGDGVVAVWDGSAKRRIKQYTKFGLGVSAIGFSPDGAFLAIGVSPGLESEHDDGIPVEEGQVKIVVRQLAEEEVKGKGKDSKKK
ncbi:nuclear pore complex subunit [Tothia fuscella]|uniref:Nuclear pore complex subunit n=1 Tax=Tothia fuscella TaxID=1048955 RepID=A0A9P4NMJ7_9PEZI|nr:nuclear pore complex subunit [Tothia fuscella]